ncbi:hypothetical protein HY440_01485 [Candidatus Microgenomates bacterium]|nr:hypothetical protein [Candidatus Microgenomates bacterium]
MTVKEAYEKYQVPPNLREHMLSVAGIATTIVDAWKDDNVSRATVVSACTVHDMANLLKFNLVDPKAISFLGKEATNVVHWRKVKEEVKAKYGPDEHQATVAICRELNLDEKALWIVDNWGFGNFDKVLASDNWEYKICVYSDHRIGPFGVVSLVDRFAEQRKRYEQQKHGSGDISAHLSDKGRLANCALEVEKQLQAKVSRDLAAITDEEINKNFEEFLSQEVS